MSVNDGSITVAESWELSNVTLDKGKYRASGSTGSILYVVTGAATEQEAIEAAYAFAPGKLMDSSGEKGIPKRQASLTERCGENAWKVQVDYGFSSESQMTDEDTDGDEEDHTPEVCFQCSNTTMHVVLPKQQTVAYLADGIPQMANPEKIPIGWNGRKGADCEFAGLDVVTGEMREQYTRWLKYGKVRGIAWRRKILSCVGCVNVGKFKGWETGEAMFLGASYSTPQRGVTKVKVTFDFLIRRNESNAKVAGIDIGDLNGHDVVWSITRDTKSSNQILPKVVAIFKARVCNYVDFDVLGL